YVSPVSGSPAAWACLISAPRAAAHSGQVNTPRVCNATAMAKACASHGSRNTGPSASRGTPGTAAAAGAPCARPHARLSRGIARGLERVDRHADGGIRVLAPQLTALEDHRVEPLRVLAPSRRGRVGEDVAAVDALDHADVSAHVTREARVRQGVEVPRAHAL